MKEKRNGSHTGDRQSLSHLTRFKERTYIYSVAGDNLGAIHDLMIDKASGKVAYAIMSFGGFLGIGNQYHPLPWSVLKYDTNLGGYFVNLDKPRLEGAPAYDVGTEPAWGDRSYEGKIHDYYGVGPYWNV